MSTIRHGVLFSPENQPQLRLGIWQVFDPWISPHLQLLQGYNVPKITRPLIIEFHFRRVVRRLIFSLAQFDQHIREWKEFLDAGGITSAHPELVFDIPEKGGVAADSIFHYLNLFIDDLARIVPIVLANDGAKPKEPKGFSALIKSIKKGEIQAPEPLRKLFAELDGEDSWWHLGFQFGTGIRQRLTHYTDLVYFAASTKPGDTKMTGDVSLINVGVTAHVPEFENALQIIFKKLCV